jgi:hypothetical protein
MNRKQNRAFLQDSFLELSFLTARTNRAIRLLVNPFRGCLGFSWLRGDVLVAHLPFSFQTEHTEKRKRGISNSEIPQFLL